MENRQKQILAEIQSMMASIRNELNLLDVKISEFQQIAEASGNEPEPIELEPIEIAVAESEPVVEPEPLVEPEPVLEPEPVAEPEPVVEPEPVAEPEPEVVDDDLPFFEEETVFAQPEPVKEEPVFAKKDSASPIIDTMLDKLAWKTDMPGSAVKDVRLAISLNDRILFINKLFAEDPMAFQSAIGRPNAMESLDQVIEYVVAEHSDWNLESDIVYRFMMAVRRKVR